MGRKKRQTVDAAMPPSPRTTDGGIDRLRRAMSLSMNVPIERVCDEAAMEIERLRRLTPVKTKWSDEAPRGMKDA